MLDFKLFLREIWGNSNKMSKTTGMEMYEMYFKNSELDRFPEREKQQWGTLRNLQKLLIESVCEGNLQGSH